MTILTTLILTGLAFSAPGDLIVPDDEDFDFVPDMGECTVENKCKGKTGRTCEPSAEESCDLKEGWSLACELLGVRVYCWAGLGDPGDRCGDLVSLELEGQMGTLTPDKLACLDGLADDKYSGIRVEASNILLAYAKKKGDDARWEAWAFRHGVLDPKDGKLLLELARRSRAKGEAGRADAVRFATAALAAEDAWAEDARGAPVHEAHRIRTEVALQQSTAGNRDIKEVRAWARDWYAAAVENGTDAKQALAVCVKAGAEDGWCKREGHWAQEE